MGQRHSQSHGGMPQSEPARARVRGIRIQLPATLSLVADQPLDETTLAIRSALTGQDAKEGLSSQQLADVLELSARAVRARMSTLIARGLVTVVGKNARDPQRKYFWRL